MRFCAGAVVEKTAKERNDRIRDVVFIFLILRSFKRVFGYIKETIVFGGLVGSLN